MANQDNTSYLQTNVQHKYKIQWEMKWRHMHNHYVLKYVFCTIMYWPQNEREASPHTTLSVVQIYYGGAEFVFALILPLPKQTPPQESDSRRLKEVPRWRVGLTIFSRAFSRPSSLWSNSHSWSSGNLCKGQNTSPEKTKTKHF